MKRNIIFFTLCCVATTVSALDNKSVRNEITIPMDSSAKAYPPDISFCIVDLKYKKPNLKICEFGQGAVSGFYGHQRLYGAGRIWRHFWDFAKTFKIPLIFLHGNPMNHHLLNSRALYSIFGSKNLICPTFNIFFKESQSQRTPLKRKKRNLETFPLSINETSGVLISSHSYLLFKNYNSIKAKCPSHMILDDATRQFVLSKLFTQLLFMNDPDLESYRPKCKILPRKYIPGMAKEIIQELRSAQYIIKPINGFKGRGLIFVTKENLEQTLQTILDPALHAENHEQQEYRYWAYHHNDFFLVESLESSQPIRINEKYYDATMRVAFALAYDHKEMTIKILDTYWKLPDKSIDEDGSLCERKKSHIRPGQPCSARVEPQTFKEIAQILLKILPKVYLKMIIARHTPNFFPPEYKPAAIAFTQSA